MGLEDCESGGIRLGGVRARGLGLRSVRSLFSVVSQDSHVVAGSLRDSLLLGRRSGCTEGRLCEALAVAELSDEVGRMSMGPDASVGDYGVGLSGGQCQRLAIARALLGRSSILVLDEAPSALGAATGRSIIRRLKVGVAVVCATHRSSVLEDARCASTRGRRDGAGRRGS